MARGRFAPSPTGDLHLGNLRTALLAWLFARSAGSEFLIRMEDLDLERVRAEHYTSQLEDLRDLGLDWDGRVTKQGDRLGIYSAVLDRLQADGHVYECFCTRREIRDAPSAPHEDLPEGAYPGTCRNLSGAERRERVAGGRPPALRIRADAARVEFEDQLHGLVEGVVDDFVLRRNDGAAAYQLAVVVDDSEAGIEQVVRGDDLLDSTPRQIFLAGLLGLSSPAYAHVPLVLGPDRTRLAKRHGAVTLGDRAENGHPPAQTLGLLAGSLGLAATGEQVTPALLVERFDPAGLPREPWVLDASAL
ncbi:MAG: glutamyl-tRNA synthetase [Thermoleophilaceae bacterium]|nr:glutamyl-tRNA synthetase [Thermoleophilaceae bacterium]